MGPARLASHPEIVQKHGRSPQAKPTYNVRGGNDLASVALVDINVSLALFESRLRVETTIILTLVR